MEFIPLAKPEIRDEDISAAVTVLQSGMLVHGKSASELELNLSKFLGVSDTALVSNGTASLHLALIILGIGKDDEVIVPAFSFVATANVVELVGAKPVFCEINLETFNIDVSKIESLITPKTKAIIPVHEFGLSCDIISIMKIAQKHKLFVIEDAACALGAKQNHYFAGTLGHFGSFSFHPRKAITSGEGGALVSNDSNLINEVKVLRNHGIEMKDGKMNFIKAGFNYRITDMQAALLVGQLNRLNEIIKIRNLIAEKYLTEIKNPLFILPSVPTNYLHTWQTFHMILPSKNARNEVMEKLNKEGIGSNYGAQCIPDTDYYSNKYGYNCSVLFPNALRANETGLAIPLYHNLTENEVAKICSVLNKICL